MNEFYVDITFFNSTTNTTGNRRELEWRISIFHGSSVGYPVKSSFSIGGGDITTSGFLFGAAVKYPAIEFAGPVFFD